MMQIMKILGVLLTLTLAAGCQHEPDPTADRTLQLPEHLTLAQMQSAITRGAENLGYTVTVRNERRLRLSYADEVRGSPEPRLELRLDIEIEPPAYIVSYRSSRGFGEETEAMASPYGYWLYSLERSIAQAADDFSVLPEPVPVQEQLGL